MNELLQLIEAAVAEDEATAKRCILKASRGTGAWHVDGMQVRDEQNILIVTHTWPHEGDHIARNSPARVLRRAAAFRRIVAAVLKEEARYDEDCGCAHTADEIAEGACRTVKLEEHEILLALASELGVPCGATATFWPDDEACPAECLLPLGHEGTTHTDDILGDWTEDELNTHRRFES